MSSLWIKLALLLSGAAVFANCSDDKTTSSKGNEDTEETGGSAGKAGSSVGKNTAGNSGKGGGGGNTGTAGSSSGNKGGSDEGQAGSSGKSSQAGGDGKAGSSGTAGSAGKLGGGGAAGAAGNKGTAGSAGKSGGTAGKSGSGGSAGSAGAAAGETGGGTSGGSGAGGTTSTTPGSTVAGYWSSKEWHGCSWTGVGAKGSSTITPKDFTANKAGDPYCAKGSVGKDPDYQGVALIGFNINETSPETCTYKAVDTKADGPPAVDKMGGTGIAINLVKQGSDTSFTFRVQIQGPDGAKEGTAGDNDRWCATITATQGKIFVPYTDFYTECWGKTEADKGNKYKGEPIDAVVFTIPGDNAKDIPFDVCINGFAYGDSAADAPDGTAVAGAQTGTVGGAGTDKDFDRAKVTVDGHDYIIQNNNWGNPDGTDLTLSYKDNSFKITSGSGSGGDAPASFPSIYIGANGNTQNGVYATTGTDKLPIQVSSISKVVSTFRYSGSTSVYNATYDIWFAKSKPSSEYKDGIDGFVMIWLRDPSGKQPIGDKKGSTTINGQSWNVWEGPRGNGPSGQNNAPVVSFVNPSEDDDSRAQSFKDVDILQFINAASQYGLPSGVYLTDVFAGFEIWSGGSGGNLSVDEFKCIVTPK